MELAGRKLYFVQFVFIVKGTQTVHTLPNEVTLESRCCSTSVISQDNTKITTGGKQNYLGSFGASTVNSLSPRYPF